MGDLNLKEVAKKLKLSYRHVVRLAKLGLLQSRRNGRERVVSMKEVIRYLEHSL